MAWFDAALADERRIFWSTIVSHEVLCRLLSCELTRAEYLCLFADFRHHDRQMPATMRRAADQCSSAHPHLRSWLERREVEHRAWFALWPNSGSASAADDIRQEPECSMPARDLCRILSADLDPARLLGALTVISWFEALVAGALRDVLGLIYGVAGGELAALECRADGPRHDQTALESVLGQLSARADRRAYCEGLRLPFPFLKAALSASGRVSIDLVPPVDIRTARRSEISRPIDARLSAMRPNAAMGQ